MNTRPTLWPRRSAALGLLLAAGVTLAACSGDDAATDTTGAPTVVSQTAAAGSSTSIAAPPTTLPLGDPSTEVTDPVDVGTAPVPGSDVPASSLAPGAESTVPVATVVPLPSVPIDETVTTPEGVVIDITSVTRVDVVGKLPGEVSGPGYQVVVLVTNRTASSLDVGPTEVNVSVGPDDQPMAGVSSASLPMSGVIGNGQTATGTFVFSAPAAPSAVVVSVSVVPGTPPAVFAGTV
ncbi:MAG: hypothetical protein WEB78_07570 [Ilumatobacteraceae bacterium]